MLDSASALFEHSSKSYYIGLEYRSHRFQKAIRKRLWNSVVKAILASFRRFIGLSSPDPLRP